VVSGVKNRERKIFLSLIAILSFYHYICALLIFYQIFIMKNGKVKFFNESKGFGFIVDSESGKEYFVHASGLIDRIRENDEVTFELIEGKKGLNAVNVKLI
jgi:CspA family cold shock protein